MGWWTGKNLNSLQDVIRPYGTGWKVFEEQRLPRTRVTPALYARLRSSIPWEASSPPLPAAGQWLAPKSEEGTIDQVFHITQVDPPLVHLYHKDHTERLQLVAQVLQPIDHQWQEVRVVECGGNRRTIFDFNPKKAINPEHTIWLWGNDWVRNLQWDPKEWHWRRIGVLPITSVLNYSTKIGYRVALKQNNHTMRVDAELEAEGFNSKTRAKFFNRIWHPYLPRKVSGMQWLILTEGLPVGAWREKLGLPNNCQLYPEQARETLQHAFQDCPEVCRVWDLFRNTRLKAGLAPAFYTWKEISRGLMSKTPGPRIEEDLKWDAAAAFTLNIDTPWDLLRANTLWAIWCQRVELAFRNEQFHLGVVLVKAWRSTILCGMEAYRPSALSEDHRHRIRRQSLPHNLTWRITLTNFFKASLLIGDPLHR